MARTICALDGCDNPIPPQHGPGRPRKYCDMLCEYEARKARQRKAYTLPRKPNPALTVRCAYPGCDVTFTQGGKTGPRQKYCGHNHAKRASYAKAEARRLGRPEPIFEAEVVG